MTKQSYDAVIIGGSYAGLSAAMSLGRSLRKVLVVDSGTPCNAPTPHSHNFITHDGKTPAEISKIARQQLESYPTVILKNDLAVAGRRIENGFQISLVSGEEAHARKLIFATGIKDILPDISGISDCWGKTVIHCPYCHGYEFRHSKTAILGDSETAMHYALLVSNLTKDLTILTNGPANFSADQKAKLEKHNINVITTIVSNFEHVAGQLKSVNFSDGTKLHVDAVYFRPPFVQQSEIPKLLGCEFTETGHLKIDSMQKTTVSGVYACGDNCSPMRAVANAVAAGNFAGASVNKELAGEDF